MLNEGFAQCHSSSAASKVSGKSRVRNKYSKNGRLVTIEARQSIGTTDRKHAERELVAYRKWLQSEADFGSTRTYIFMDLVDIYANHTKANARFLIKIVPETGEDDAAQITLEDIQDVVEELYPSAKVSTIIRKVFTLINALYKFTYDNAETGIDKHFPRQAPQ